MNSVKKYVEKYTSDIFGYFGAALIGSAIGLALCKLI